MQRLALQQRRLCSFPQQTCYGCHATLKTLSWRQEPVNGAFEAGRVHSPVVSGGYGSRPGTDLDWGPLPLWGTRMAPHDSGAALLRAAQAETRNASEKTLLRRLFDDVLAEDIEAYGARDLASLAAGRLAFLSE